MGFQEVPKEERVEFFIMVDSLFKNSFGDNFR